MVQVLFPLLKMLVDLAKSIFALFVGRTAWFMSDERAWISLLETAMRMCELTIGSNWT
jgi:hypothetical protein